MDFNVYKKLTLRNLQQTSKRSGKVAFFRASREERHAKSSVIQRKQTRFPSINQELKATRTPAAVGIGWQQNCYF